jgi:hypothetical protein
VSAHSTNSEITVTIVTTVTTNSRTLSQRGFQQLQNGDDRGDDTVTVLFHRDQLLRISKFVELPEGDLII